MYLKSLDNMPAVAHSFVLPQALDTFVLRKNINQLYINHFITKIKKKPAISKFFAAKILLNR